MKAESGCWKFFSIGMPSCCYRSYTNGKSGRAVAFGAKRSGHEYSAEDFRLLATLTDQLALSLKNGRLYEESIQAYQRVENSNRKLIEMDRVKKDFVANICHELRTPVSTIIGFSEILRDLDLTGGARYPYSACQQQPGAVESRWTI